MGKTVDMDGETPRIFKPGLHGDKTEKVDSGLDTRETLDDEEQEHGH